MFIFEVKKSSKSLKEILIKNNVLMITRGMFYKI